MSIPNLLSLLRLVLVPVFAVVFFQPAPDAHRWAVLIYLTAFLTDVADGWIARGTAAGQGRVRGPGRLGGQDRRMVVGGGLTLLKGDGPAAWKGGHGGGEETAAILGIAPSLVDQSEVAGPMKLHDVSDTLKATGFTSIEYKGVTVNIPRLTPSVTHNGWIGPDHPETATEEWGRGQVRGRRDQTAAERGKDPEGS